MTLLREALDLGAFPSSATVRRAFEILEDELGRPEDLPADTRNDVEKTLDEIRDCIRTNECCKRFRDLLYEMGLFGSARSRRVKALAAQLGIPIEDITDCLAKDRDELDDDADAEITLGLQDPSIPLDCDDPEAPIDLKTLLCLEIAPPPDPDDFCPAPPLPGEEDTRPIKPFPRGPTPNQTNQLCDYILTQLHRPDPAERQALAAPLTSWARYLGALATSLTLDPKTTNLSCLSETTAQAITLADELFPGPEGGAIKALLAFAGGINADRIRHLTTEISARLGELDIVLARAKQTGITEGGRQRVFGILTDVEEIASTNKITEISARARDLRTQFQTQQFSPPPFQFADPFNPQYRVPKPRIRRHRSRYRVPEMLLPPSLEID